MISKKWVFLVICIILTSLIALECNIQPSKGAFLNVEATLCIGCGACTKVCQGDAILLVGNKAVIDPTKCIQCGKCVKVCPYDAIH
jgi:Na+-translocating ferredoxin:NAD+ oxidoreductase subunit B